MMKTIFKIFKDTKSVQLEEIIIHSSELQEILIIK